MKLVLQRVLESSVSVEGEVTGEIGQGYMALVGIGNQDNEETIEKMVDKMIHLRVFSDENGKMNLSLSDVQGSVLSISQFTLYADCQKGRRPSFIDAAKPNEAKRLYEYFNHIVEACGIHVEKGVFGADMKVSLVNDGPVSIILDSEKLLKKPLK